MSSTTSTYFYALTIRKQLPGNDFERSGRGQEPSRGHKFSILENVLSIRDFTSAMRLHFRSDLVGVALVGATPLHLLSQTALPLKSPTGAFIAPLRCVGGIFLLRELHLENFMSRPDVIPTFRQRRCTNRGRNFVRSKRRFSYMSRTTSTYFCVLTIRKQSLKIRFERSGRGQEPSRGHKFSILENFLSIRDFTSTMRLHFRSDLVGACLPQTLLIIRA